MIDVKAGFKNFSDCAIKTLIVLANKQDLFKPSITNIIPLSTEADGKTIYNNGLGYKDNCRVRSAGGEEETDCTSCTGYIPYKKGDVLYISPYFLYRNAVNAINFYNKNFECLGQFTAEDLCYGFCNVDFKPITKNGVTIVDISHINIEGIESVRYVRITNGTRYAGISNDIRSGSQMIILKETNERLPQEYQQVEWIHAEQDVGAYLNLGFSFDTAAKIKMGMYKINTVESYIFGVAEQNGTYRCMITAPYESTKAYTYGSTGSAFAATCVDLRNGYNDLECVIQPNSVSITNMTTGALSSYTGDDLISYKTTKDLLLFAQNYNGNIRHKGHRKITYFKYYDKNNSLICDLIPCYRKKDGVIGMYDAVNKRFLTNIGTGAFLKGVDI